MRFVGAGDLSPLGAAIDVDLASFDNDWSAVSIPVPNEAIGEQVRVEFQFMSDSTVDSFSGWSLDNVMVVTE